MNAEEYAAAWLSEMWRPVREVSREERDAERELARVSPAVPQPVDKGGENGSAVAS